MATKSIAPRRRTDDTPGSYDWGLITIVTTLLLFGAVIVFSASFAQGLYGYDNIYFFVGRQLLFMTAGIVAMIVVARIPYNFWQIWAIPVMGVSLLFLLAVLIVGSDTLNARRTFFGGSVQPSEAAKLGVVIYASAWLASKGTRIRDVRVGLLPFSVLLGVVVLLLVAQPDFSTTLLIVATAFIMFFIAGADLRQLFIVGVGGSATFWLIFQYSAYAAHVRERLDLYTQSLWNPLQSEQWQTSQAIQALLRGGLFGVGPGEGQAKLPGRLPVSWQDNIYAVIGEEMGMIGALLILLLFALLAYYGLRTALRAPDNFGAILATGITTLLTLQAILHMSVTVAITPPTGLTLPFISYGGSSLVSMMAAVGILLSISRGLPAAATQTGSASGLQGRRAASSSDPTPNKPRPDANQTAAGGLSSRSADNNISGKTNHARFDFGWRDWGARLSGAGSSRTAKRTDRPGARTSTTGRAARPRRRTE